MYTYVCTCVYVYMYICVYNIRIYIYVYIHIYIYTYIHIYIYTYIHIYIYTYIHIYIYTYIHIYIYTYIHIYIYTYIHIYIYTYIHTHTNSFVTVIFVWPWMNIICSHVFTANTCLWAKTPLEGSVRNSYTSWYIRRRNQTNRPLLEIGGWKFQTGAASLHDPEIGGVSDSSFW